MIVPASSIEPFGTIGIPPIRTMVNPDAIHKDIDDYVNAVTKANREGYPKGNSGAFPDIVKATVKHKAMRRGATFANCVHFGDGKYQLVFELSNDEIYLVQFEIP